MFYLKGVRAEHPLFFGALRGSYVFLFLIPFSLFADEYDVVIDNGDYTKPVLLNGNNQSLYIQERAFIIPDEDLYGFAIGNETARNWKVINDGYIYYQLSPDGAGLRLQGGNNEIINRKSINATGHGILIAPSGALPRDDDYTRIVNTPGAIIHADKSAVSLAGSADIYNEGEISGGNIGLIASANHGENRFFFRMENSGVISGTSEGVFVSNYLSRDDFTRDLVNKTGGQILSSHGDGIALYEAMASTIENQSGGLISGFNRGIYEQNSIGAFLELYNGGDIRAERGAAVSSSGGGHIFNYQTGSIQGAGGIAAGAAGLESSYLQIHNEGVIIGNSSSLSDSDDARYDFGSGAGITAASSRFVINNYDGALISGGVYGINRRFYNVPNEVNWIVNDGTVYGGETGIFVQSGSMSIKNSGRIEGGNGPAIVFSQESDHNTSTLTLKTGSEILGGVTGPAWGDSALMLEGHGEQDLSRFSQINHLSVVNPGDRWRLTGASAFTGNGTSTYSGMWANGTMIIDGDIITTRLNVSSAGELAGKGSLAGEVYIDGGRLTGRQGETFRILGDLTMWGGNIDVALGTPASRPLFSVSGNLSLQGELSVRDLGGFGAGVYRLFDYGQTFTDYGLSIASAPEGVLLSDLSVQTSIDKQVNLINTSGMQLGFWNGEGAADGDGVRGGDGRWDVVSAHWTDAEGKISSTWRDEFAIFQGRAGQVVVDNGTGQVGIQGMQFVSDGYRVSGDGIALLREETIIRVGDGQQKSAGMMATIESPLTGTGGLTKTDYGTLLLRGKNSYSGLTQVTQGALIVGDETHRDASISGPVRIFADATLGGYGLLAGSIDNHGTLLAGNMKPESGTPASMRIQGNLNNSGQIVLSNGEPGNLLTVRGNYHGNDGALSLSAKLGADDSLSDRLVVEGDTSGTTRVSVVNAGGRGASTLSGIELIQVKGKSEGEFTQHGRIVAGAYDYHLVRGKGDLAGNWYLSSLRGGEDEGGGGGVVQPDPETRVMRAESAAYTANHAAANSLFLSPLPERPGNDDYRDMTAGERRHSGFWLRSSAGKQRWKDSSGQLTTRSHRLVTTMGADLVRPAENASIGVMAGVARQRGSSSSNVNKVGAKSDIRGYSLGPYAHWTEKAGGRGAWLTGWAQYNWFSNSVQGDELMSESYKSKGFTAAAEGGYRREVYASERGAFVLEPKGRVAWMNVKSDAVLEHNGTRVRSIGANTVQTKAGLKLSYSETTAGPEPYIEASWIHQPRSSGVRLDETTLYQAGSRNTAEIRIGIAGNLSSDLNLWAALGQQRGGSGYSDGQAMAGLRLTF